MTTRQPDISIKERHSNISVWISTRKKAKERFLENDCSGLVESRNQMVVWHKNKIVVYVEQLWSYKEGLIIGRIIGDGSAIAANNVEVSIESVCLAG